MGIESVVAGARNNRNRLASPSRWISSDRIPPAPRPDRMTRLSDDGGRAMTTMRLLLQQDQRRVVTPALQQAIQLLQLKAGVAGVGAVTIR